MPQLQCPMNKMIKCHGHLIKTASLPPHHLVEVTIKVHLAATLNLQCLMKAVVKLHVAVVRTAILHLHRPMKTIATLLLAKTIVLHHHQLLRTMEKLHLVIIAAINLRRPREAMAILHLAKITVPRHLFKTIAKPHLAITAALRLHPQAEEILHLIRTRTVCLIPRFVTTAALHHHRPMEATLQLHHLACMQVKHVKALIIALLRLENELTFCIKSSFNPCRSCTMFL